MSEATVSYHPESKAMLEIIAKLNDIPLDHSLSPVEAARQHSRDVSTGPAAAGTYHFDGTRTEMFVPLPDTAETIPVYIYTPSNLAPNSTIVVYFHGGGLVVGSRENVEKTCQILAFDARCLVVNVEYRLAPEHRFPVYLDDSCAAVRWVLSNKTLIGGTSLSRVGVGGDSGGGTLAASVAHDVQGLAFQILVYPKVVDYGVSNLKSYDEYKDDPIIPSAVIEWFASHSLDPADNTNPRISSIRRPSFDKLPPALFIVAQCDPIRDDSYEYARKLREAGVTTEFYQFDGAIHGFYTWPGAFPTLTKEAYEKTVNFIKKFSC